MTNNKKTKMSSQTTLLKATKKYEDEGVSWLNISTPADHKPSGEECYICGCLDGILRYGVITKKALITTCDVCELLCWSMINREPECRLLLEEDPDDFDNWFGKDKYEVLAEYEKEGILRSTGKFAYKGQVVDEIKRLIKSVKSAKKREEKKTAERVEFQRIMREKEEAKKALEESPRHIEYTAKRSTINKQFDIDSAEIQRKIDALYQERDILYKKRSEDRDALYDEYADIVKPDFPRPF